MLECLPISVSKQKKVPSVSLSLKSIESERRIQLRKHLKYAEPSYHTDNFDTLRRFLVSPPKKSHIVVYSILDLFSGFFGSLILCHFTEKSVVDG